MDTQDDKKIILDTDISSDADDVGAVAVLHNIANSENIEILAMMASSADPWSGGTLAALNSFYGKPDIPLGTVGQNGVRHESSYTKEIASLHETPPVLENAVPLYRRILAEQPNKSVTIITIGFLTNLENLLNSNPDEHSELSGLDLVKQKVNHLVCMGGQYPTGNEWNFYQDPVAAKAVVEHWPSRIYFAGFELGEKIITGKRLEKHTSNHPVAMTYKLHNSFLGRPSWDQLAVLFGTQNEIADQSLFRVSDPGKNQVSADGVNTWNSMKSGEHFYLYLNKGKSEIAEIIEDLMN